MDIRTVGDHRQPVDEAFHSLYRFQITKTTLYMFQEHIKHFIASLLYKLGIKIAFNRAHVMTFVCCAEVRV